MWKGFLSVMFQAYSDEAEYFIANDREIEWKEMINRESNMAVECGTPKPSFAWLASGAASATDVQVTRHFRIWVFSFFPFLNFLLKYSINYRRIYRP